MAEPDRDKRKEKAMEGKFQSKTHKREILTIGYCVENSTEEEKKTENETNDGKEQLTKPENKKKKKI